VIDLGLSKACLKLKKDLADESNTTLHLVSNIGKRKIDLAGTSMQALLASHVIVNGMGNRMPKDLYHLC